MNPGPLESMPDANPQAAAQQVPPGRWGIAVSGGADSVALLEWLLGRPDLQLHVIHLDHQTRAGQSALDAAFVAELAQSRGLAITLATRCQLENETSPISPQKNGAGRISAAQRMRSANRSAHFRRLRLELFRQCAEHFALQGVILAHHADDQAETILQRLLRGGGPAGLRGIQPDHRVAGVRLLRPMLAVRRSTLRAILHDKKIPWREDSSNASMNQQRNRVRSLLAKYPELFDSAMQLRLGCSRLVDWLRDAAPVLADRFAVAGLCDLPRPLAMESARRWLSDHAGAGVEIPPRAAMRLISMAEDAATPARQHFPGRLLVRRRGGFIEPA